ncbi:MAG: LptE family protein [Bacteroidetes bacterium]|nr:LptE family protein [Bacteroidota bacterium]
MKTFRNFLFASFTLLILQSSFCKFPYSLTGGRPELTDTVTVSVLPFTNSAPLAKATYANSLTESLRDAIQRQTRMKMVPSGGDLNFEGNVTAYSVSPAAIQAGTTNQAAMNRLTITVNVKYTDAINNKLSFNSNFSRYSDFSASQNLASVEDQLIKDINDQLVQDIMNRSINAW